jgi:hypothetical protein
MKLVLTPKEQVHLQKAYVLAREAVQEMMYITRDRKLNSAINKIFDAADIMDMYIEPTREGQKT